MRQFGAPVVESHTVRYFTIGQNYAIADLGNEATHNADSIQMI